MRKQIKINIERNMNKPREAQQKKIEKGLHDLAL